MIRAEGLVVRGRLDGVDLHVRKGELCVLVGPNGAGKSTLLAALAGDLRAERGAVTLAGRALSRWDRRALARRRAVVLQQVPAAFPLTVAEVVSLGRLPHGDERRADTIVARALSEVGLLGFAARLYPTLSGGERQRVQIARAFAQLDGVIDPVLLLDEPTAAADLAWQERLLAGLRARADAGATVVVVLHDLNLAVRWAHAIVLLSNGWVAAAGATDVLTAPRLSAAWGVRFDVYDLGGRPVFFPTLEIP
ncbi:MAG: ATP-binding cassette domain-containing protein [Myxococcota bacterium]